MNMMNMIIYRISIHLEDIKQAMFRHFNAADRPGIVGALARLNRWEASGGRTGGHCSSLAKFRGSQLSRSASRNIQCCLCYDPHTYKYYIILYHIINYYYYIYIIRLYIYIHTHTVCIYIHVNSSFIVAHGCWLYSDLCFVYPLARSPWLT